MKGELFIYLERFICESWSEEIFRAIHTGALSQLKHRGTFQAGVDYAQIDLRVLIAHSGLMALAAPNDLLFAFGRHSLRHFSADANAVLTTCKNPSEALMRLQAYFMPCLNYLWPEAQIKINQFHSSALDQIVIKYEAPQECSAFLDGLLSALAEYYASGVHSTRKQTRNNGSETCELQIRFTSQQVT